MSVNMTKRPNLRKRPVTAVNLRKPLINTRKP